MTKQILKIKQGLYFFPLLLLCIVFACLIVQIEPSKSASAQADTPAESIGEISVTNYAFTKKVITNFPSDTDVTDSPVHESVWKERVKGFNNKISGSIDEANLYIDLVMGGNVADIFELTDWFEEDGRKFQIRTGYLTYTFEGNDKFLRIGYNINLREMKNKNATIDLGSLKYNTNYTLTISVRGVTGVVIFDASLLNYFTLNYKFDVIMIAPVSNNQQISQGYNTKVDNVYYYNRDMMFSWEDGGERRPKGNAKINGVVCESGKVLKQEGRYVIEFWNTVISETYEVIIDKTAPKYNFSNAIKKEGSEEYFALVDKIPILNWTYVKDKDAPITLKINGAETTAANVDGSYNYAFEFENTYVIELLDYAGNKAETRLTSDLTAPNYTLKTNTIDLSSGAFAKCATFTANDNGSGLKNIYCMSPTGEITTVSNDYFNLSPIGQDGCWELWADDYSGNILKPITVYIDTTPAVNNYLNRYTNQSINYCPIDGLSGVSSVFYKRPGSNTFAKATGATYSVQTDKNNFGEWSFYCIDNVGNVSETVLACLSVVNTFENKATIKDSYKLNVWWQVNLPERIFNKEAGIYTFADKDFALKYAIRKETEYRCSKVANGWVYINATNESVSQVYTSKEELDKAILKYSKRYLSDRQIMKNGSNNYNILLNAQGEKDKSALTSQSLEFPTYLESYKNKLLFLCFQNQTFNRLQLSYLDNMQNAHTVKAKFIADDVQLIQNSAILTIEFGVSLGAALKSYNAYKQGYYLISETDICGNVEDYIIYLDLQTSEILGTVEMGDGTKKVVTFNEKYIKDFAKTFYYVSFTINKMFDNIDNLLCVNIYNTNKNYIYIQSDELPILNKDFGSGKWTIAIYDRSQNLLTFDIMIAGELPNWNYTSLKSPTRCTITFNAGSSENALVSLTLFKVSADGDYVKLLQDDEGTAIDFTNLTYVIKNGGKYAAEIKDVFGRTVRTSPIFYMKDLPEGVLSCTEGARTNRNVKFSYTGANALIVYKYENGNKVQTSNFLTEYNNKTDTYTVTVEATADNSSEYILFLYKADDRSIFIEYGFTIDCIMADILITDKNGNSLKFDSATSLPFNLRWNETVNVSCWKSTTVGGEIGAERYNMGTEITADGLYYFSARDSVGNTSKFSVLLDTKVSYQIDGNYKIVNGIIVAKEPLTITILETTTKFKVTNKNDYTFVNGGTIVKDGVYTLEVLDVYGNKLTLVFLLDFEPPKVTLEGVEKDSITKDKVKVSCDETLSLTDKNGNIIKNIESGTEFDENGIYYIRAEDLAGNVTTVSFSIDRAVDYTLNVPNGLITSDKVFLVFSEEVTLNVTLDGRTIDERNYIAQGHYVILAKDKIGNEVKIEFTVIAERAKNYSFALPHGITLRYANLNDTIIELTLEDGKYILNQNGVYILALENKSGEIYKCKLTVDNILPTITIKQDGNSVKLESLSKENCNVTIKRDGMLIDGKIGTTFNKAGVYTVIVVDDVGNVNEFTFTIDYKVNTWGIALTVIGIILAGLLLVVIILVRRKPKVR